MKPLSKRRRYLLLAYAVFFCGFVTVAFVMAFRASGGEAQPIGMVRKTEIRMGPEVGGYVKDIPFKRGDAVRAGDVIATLTSPEVEAAVLQARKALGQAEAARARVYAGVRYEEIESEKQEVEKAKSNVKLAQSQHERAKQLVRTGDVSQQVLDDRSAQLANARSALTAAEASLAKAQKGATAEDKVKADKTVDLAKASLESTLAKQAKLVLYAPVDAVVWNVVAEPGEVVTMGQPILTLERRAGVWFDFNIREDRLGRITVGSVLSLKTGDGKLARARVTEMRNLGDFAVWHAERAIASYDLATFEVRADLVGEAPETLQPGMTTWIEQVE